MKLPGITINNWLWLTGMNKHLGGRWLLLRGLSRESAHWGDFLDVLQVRLPNTEIDTLDLPGTGELCREASPLSITEIVAQLRDKMLQRDGLRQPLTLLGLSLGGMVAWEWAGRYPQEICGTVMINSSFANLSPFHRRLRWQSYTNVFKVLGQHDQERRELAILKWVINRRDMDGLKAAEWADIQRQHPVKFQNTIRQLVAAAAYKPVSRPPQPVLLMNSLGDRLVDPRCSAAISERWQVPLMTHPWGGHDLTLDDGSWVAKQLQLWVKQYSQPHNERKLFAFT